jgi:hypothetical protein
MKQCRRFVALPFALTLLAVAACSTETVGPGHVLIANTQPGPEQGAFVVSYASSADSFQADQARLATGWQAPLCHVTLDGQLLAEYEGTAGSSVPQLLPVTVEEGGLAGVGYLDAGSHHFAIVAPDGSSIFQGDGTVQGGGNLRLFLYGDPGALQGRFAYIPSKPAAGQEHITVVNTMRSGQVIEVVSCTDAATCTPISPSLALGDLFDTEVPAIVSENGFASLTPDGAGIGFRLVPSASVPDPPVLGLYVGAEGAVGSGLPPNEIFVVAPSFMSDQGQLLEGFN